MAGNLDDGVILLCCTMVWIRFNFFVVEAKMYQFPPRPMGLRKHGSECNHERQPQLPCISHKDITINEKKAGEFLVNVWGRLQKLQPWLQGV